MSDKPQQSDSLGITAFDPSKYFNTPEAKMQLTAEAIISGEEAFIQKAFEISYGEDFSGIVQVHISGPSCVGKTSVASIISNALKEAGIDVEYRGDDTLDTTERATVKLTHRNPKVVLFERNLGRLSRSNEVEKTAS